MSESFPIQYIPRKSLDTQKWDRCINSSENGLIYAYSFYLDEMAANWDALVFGDYEMVMPLTWNKKYGIKYLYQPFLTAQLGIFGNDCTGDIVQDFLENIPSTFKYWDIYLNHQNVFHLQKFELYPRNNYVMSLESSYDEIEIGYRDNSRRNSRKAFQSGCKVEKGFSPEKVVELALQQMRTYGQVVDDQVSRFRRLYDVLKERDMCTTYGIVSGSGELLSSCVFFFSHKRAYYILVGNHPNGKTLGASHALIDAFIRDHAGTDMLLDFEGSDIQNLAFFYSSFGAKIESFAGLRVNKLPFFLKWLKD